MNIILSASNCNVMRFLEGEKQNFEHYIDEVRLLKS
jgi:hypothetical protein